MLSIPGHRRQRGVGMVEIVIALAIVGILLGAGVTSFASWIQNSRIRAAADSLQTGLQRARVEAVKRNAQVRFQLTDTLSSSCALSTTSVNWVISVNSAVGKCATAPSETADPRIIEVRPAAEGTANVKVLADQASIVFSGLGRVTPTPAGAVSIDVKSISGTCSDSGGAVRCLRVVVSSAGQVRTCDPAQNSSNVRAC